MNILSQELGKCSCKVESYLTTSDSIGIVLLNSDLIIQEINPGFSRLFNPSQDPAGDPISDYLEIDAGDIQCDGPLKLASSRKAGKEAITYCHIIRTENGYLLFCERQILTESRVLERIGGINNELINLQRDLVKKNHLLEKLQCELDLRVSELEATLLRVKQLEGIIPICMYCKKIRDDQQSWHQLEAYISEHSAALFSHGICPECFKGQMKIIKDMK